MRLRLSPSLIVSIVALVLAVGGTAVAGTYLITSTKQIKPSVLKKLKGRTGPKGSQGAPGTPGATVAYKSVLGSANVPQGTVKKIDATCPPGFVVTGGGVGVGSNSLVYAGSFDSHTYEAAVGNFSNFPTAVGTVQAFCASGLAPTATTAATRTLSASQRSALIAEYSASHHTG